MKNLEQFIRFASPTRDKWLHNNENQKLFLKLDGIVSQQISKIHWARFSRVGGQYNKANYIGRIILPSGRLALLSLFTNLGRVFPIN